MCGDTTAAVPHGPDDVRLSQLNHDGAAAELMACVARVPVVVLGVAVDERIAAAAYALDHTSAALHRRHVRRRNCSTYMQLFRVIQPSINRSINQSRIFRVT